MEGGGIDRRVPLKNDSVWVQARALRRLRLVLVCFARLALAPYPPQGGASASTIGEGASARSAEGGASASTLG